MPLINIKCFWCGQTFGKKKKYYNHNLKNNRKNFCSKDCSYKYSSFAQSDEFSIFRYFIKRLKERSRKRSKTFNLSVIDLKTLWDNQSGICPYTGWKLKITREKSIYQASLDRKNSSIGYELNNVQWVSLIAQFAKNDFSEQELLIFCKTVANNENINNCINFNLSTETYVQE